jgi:hypothetical protein
MKNNIIILAFAALFGAASCTTIHPVTATNNPIGGATGKSTTNCLFPLVTASIPSAAMAGKGFNIVSSGMCFNKEYGVIEAAKNGKIERIATVDLKKTNFLIFTQFELIVTGE